MIKIIYGLTYMKDSNNYNGSSEYEQAIVFWKGVVAVVDQPKFQKKALLN
jgi:hypothetical protein